MLELFLSSKKWLVGLLLANLAGFLFGIYYYWMQLSTTPFWLWVFVIDCPLYVLLFSFICFRRLKGKEGPDWLYYLTAVGLIKYGIWTGLVVWLYAGYFFSFSPVMYAILFPLHIGMILEGIVLLPWLRTKLIPALGILGWFLFNDWLDYFAGTVPTIPAEHLTFLMWESFIATFLLTGAIYLIRWKRGGNYGKS